MKAVFYETDRFRGFQDKESYPRVMYDRELTPMRIAIVGCTLEGIEAILTLDSQEQRDIIGSVLDECTLTIYSN